MKTFSTFVIALLALIAVNAHASGVPEDDLKEYGRGIIQDYSNMHEGEDIQWLWIAPGVKLADSRYKVASVKNLTMLVDHDMENVFKTTLGEELERAGSRDAGVPQLSVDVGVYWAERANMAKAWIPFAGAHVAQAGVGIELVFRNAHGDIVAKVRQSGREGAQLADAARELCDDIAQFVHTH